MRQYLNLVDKILKEGVDRPDRTGIGSKACWGEKLEFNLSAGFPALTTRKVAFRIAFEETMFFLRGDTDTKKLEEKNINIWKGNTSREFLDSRKLDYLPEGDMGKGYGHQWRHFNGKGYERIFNPWMLEVSHYDGSRDYRQKGGVDQIAEVLSDLKTNPHSRRHVVTTWNPSQLHEMALPPCHLLMQFQVLEGKLNSLFFMRSTDVIYGLPYNIMSYAFITEAFSRILGLTPGKLIYFGGDVHIYNNQLEIAKQQLCREPKILPTITFDKNLASLEDLLQIEFGDVTLENYEAYPDFKDKPRMAI